jgi:hypothetical protein
VRAFSTDWLEGAIWPASITITPQGDAMSGAHGHGHVEGNKKIALLISVLALFLALVETMAKGAQTNALSYNIEASNLWSFFQAKTIRQTVGYRWRIVGSGELRERFAVSFSGGWRCRSARKTLFRPFRTRQPALLARPFQRAIRIFCYASSWG